MLLATALLALSPAMPAAAAAEAAPAFRAEVPQARSFVAQCAATERSSPLRSRLQAIRQRIADRRAAEQELARQMRIQAELRPFSTDAVGSHARRARLGQRMLASPNDARLGSLARRQIYSSPEPVQRARPRR